MTTPNRLPIVKLMFDAKTGEYDAETGTERLFFADLRLKEYRSVDGNEPWIVKSFEVSGSMEEIIEQYEVKDAERELGVEAVIFLQSVADITEPRDRAERAWDSFKTFEKVATMQTYRLLKGKS